MDFEENALEIIREVARGELGYGCDYGYFCVYCAWCEENEREKAKPYRRDPNYIDYLHLKEWYDKRNMEVDHEKDCLIVKARHILRELGQPMRVYACHYHRAEHDLVELIYAQTEEEAREGFNLMFSGMKPESVEMKREI